MGSCPCEEKEKYLKEGRKKSNVVNLEIVG